jgi:hypothetical protein
VGRVVEVMLLVERMQLHLPLRRCEIPKRRPLRDSGGEMKHAGIVAAALRLFGVAGMGDVWRGGNGCCVKLRVKHTSLKQSDGGMK